MILKVLVCPLLACLAYGQATPASDLPADTTNQTRTASPEETKVAPDNPVITINDFCTGQSPAEHACKTVITRAQFEKLTEALEPGMPLPLRLKVADAYARNLRMSSEAEKRGIDKTPAFQEEMRYARIQLLSQDLNRQLQQEANAITDTDLWHYYKQHESEYEQATFARIFVPHARQSAPRGDAMGTDKETQAKETQPDVDVMIKFADELRTRAANGEDPDKLQIEAYHEAGIERTTVNTKMDSVRRTSLPPQHTSVMELKLGEVSQVFSDPEGAHFIYKMLNKETLTLEDAKMEIRATIAKEKYRNSMKDFEGNTVFSDAYFNPPGKTHSTTQPRERRAKTPGQP